MGEMCVCVCMSMSVCGVCVFVCVHVHACIMQLMWSPSLPHLSVLMHEKHWASSVQTWSKDHTIMMAVALIRDDA